MTGRILLEIDMVKIWHISPVCHYLIDPLIERDGLADLRNAIFDVNVLDVQHIDRPKGGFLHGLEGLKQRVEEELDVLFFEAHA